MRGRLIAALVATVVAVGLAVLVHEGRGPATTATSPTATAPPRPPVDAAWTERGANVTSYKPGVFTSPAVGPQLDAIKATGTSTIGIVVTWYQPTADASAIAPDPNKSATDDDVRVLAQQARDRGLRLALKPQVDVLDGTFRGEIRPSDQAAWMASYDAFITHEADLAKEIGAQVFVIGTELSSQSGRTDDWRTLIGQVRSRYQGTLTYGANWVQEARKVAFWDALDVIGVDAYMPLSKDDPDPGVAALVDAWRPWRDQLQQLHDKTGKPVLFTEVGYPSRIGAAQQPSREGSGQISQPAQQRLYEAVFQAWKGTPWFQGAWWWNWPADGGDPQAEAGGYPPVGKLAQGTLTRWLATAPGSLVPAPTGTVATAP